VIVYLGDFLLDDVYLYRVQYCVISDTIDLMFYQISMHSVLPQFFTNTLLLEVGPSEPIPMMWTLTLMSMLMVLILT
jgi:hypothetical protein